MGETTQMTVAESTDKLDPKRLSERLADCSIGRPIFCFDAIGSTNTFLRELDGEKARHGALAVAEHQHGGRGRLDRRWCDRPGRSVLFSLLLDAPRPPGRWPLLTLGASTAVCRVLEALRLSPRIRWPNDVLVDGGKICGILSERSETRPMLVLGVGLNVHQADADFPVRLRGAATSVRMALAKAAPVGERAADGWRRSAGRCA